MSHTARSGQQGFSLLEVLIAILVLCFGVLGMVGLQAASLQVNREARLQSSAIRLAEEMAEMMRGNKDVAVNLTTSPYLLSSTTATSPNCGYPSSSAACTTTNAVAQRDVYEWLERVKAELPGSKVVICQDSTPYDTAGLPQWACSDTGGTVVLKMGWTRSNTLRGASGADATTTSGANTGAFDKALRPAVTFPLIPGSTS
jgi:type IV pilus assembly protein PilV